jgi:hypothetical protein
MNLSVFKSIWEVGSSSNIHLKEILTIKKKIYFIRLENVILVIIVLELSYTFVLELGFKVMELKLYLLESSGI